MKIKVVDKITIKEVDIKKLREKAGLSLKDLQDKTGIKYSYLSILENGKTGTLRKETWDRIKKALKK